MQLLLADDGSIAKAFQTFDLYKRASGQRLTRANVKVYGVEPFLHNLISLTSLNGLMTTSPKQFNNIIDAWCHRDLSYKGKALVINELVTLTLWYNNTIKQDLPVSRDLIEILSCHQSKTKKSHEIRMWITSQSSK